MTEKVTRFAIVRAFVIADMPVSRHRQPLAWVRAIAQAFFQFPQIVPVDILEKSSPSDFLFGLAQIGYQLICRIDATCDESHGLLHIIQHFLGFHWITGHESGNALDGSLAAING